MNNFSLKSSSLETMFYLSHTVLMTKEQLWEQGKEIVVNAPQLYIDVDIEADGIAGFGSMVSIGAVNAHGETFYSEIRPDSQDYLPGHREFCETHGLPRERLQKEAPCLYTVMPRLHEWVLTLQERYGKPSVFTAFNAAFDWAHVDLSFTKCGIENPFGIAPFDLKSLALPLTKGWNWKETSKSKLPVVIIPDGDFTHHALEDAQYQQKLHFGMAALLGSNRFVHSY